MQKSCVQAFNNFFSAGRPLAAIFGLWSDFSMKGRGKCKGMSQNDAARRKGCWKCNFYTINNVWKAEIPWNYEFFILGGHWRPFWVFLGIWIPKSSGISKALKPFLVPKILHTYLQHLTKARAPSFHISRHLEFYKPLWCRHLGMKIVGSSRQRFSQ